MLRLVKARRKFSLAWYLISITIFFLPICASAKTTDCELAKLYVAKGKTHADSEYYQKANDICPGYIRPYELLGNWYRKKAEASKAIELFSKASELGSTNYKLYYLLADLLFQEGKIDESHKYIEKSLRLKSDYPKSITLKLKI